MYIFCQCYMKTWHFKVSHSQKFRPLKCRFSLWSSPAKKPPNLNIVATISNSTQQPGRVFMMSFLLRDFVLMASNKSFNDHSGLWLLLSHIILSQTCSKLWNDSIEDSEVDNHVEKKKRFCWPCEGCQVSGRIFSFLPVLSRTEWRHITSAWLPRQFQSGSLLSRFFQDEFLQDNRHFRGWN